MYRAEIDRKLGNGRFTDTYNGVSIGQELLADCSGFSRTQLLEDVSLNWHGVCWRQTERTYDGECAAGEM